MRYTHDDLTPPARTSAHDVAFYTYECIDCGWTRKVKANGKPGRHRCRMPRRLRGRVGRAWSEGYQWGLSDGRGDDALVARARDEAQG